MNARTYTMNPEAAKAAGASQRIDETGAYAGTFSRAEAVRSKQGTEGIEFSFANKVGREAGFLTLWTYKPDGTELSGAKMVSALMTCMKVRSMKPEMRVIEKWQDGQKVKVQAEVYPDLMGKEIGLLLAVEPYEANDGTIKHQMLIEGCFEVAGHRTAKNVLENKPDDGTLDRWIDSLKDRKLRKRQGASNDGYPTQRLAPAPAGSGFDSMDSDIPW